MKFRPLHDRVIVRRIPEAEVVSGAVIIPDTAKEKPQEGEIIAVGKGKILENGRLVKLDVKPGDRVLFGKYSGNEIKLEGEEYLILREDEVLAIVEKGALVAIEPTDPWPSPPAPPPKKTREGEKSPPAKLSKAAAPPRKKLTTE